MKPMADAGPRILVLSGPSGAGKTTIARHLEQDDRLRPSISATTRPKRPSEEEGKDYYFLTRELFEQWRATGEFIETAEVFGNLYGTPRKGLRSIHEGGRTPLLDVDVQGARELRRLGYGGVYVFIRPPDLATLRQRLEQRGTAPAEVERRLARYEWEMSHRAELYNFEVENRDLDRAIAEVETIVKQNLFGDK